MRSMSQMHKKKNLSVHACQVLRKLHINIMISIITWRIHPQLFLDTICGGQIKDWLKKTNIEDSHLWRTKRLNFCSFFFLFMKLQRRLKSERKRVLSNEPLMCFALCYKTGNSNTLLFETFISGVNDFPQSILIIDSFQYKRGSFLRASSCGRNC